MLFPVNTSTVGTVGTKTTAQTADNNNYDPAAGKPPSKQTALFPDIMIDLKSIKTTEPQTLSDYSNHFVNGDTKSNIDKESLKVSNLICDDNQIADNESIVSTTTEIGSWSSLCAHMMFCFKKSEKTINKIECLATCSCKPSSLRITQKERCDIRENNETELVVKGGNEKVNKEQNIEHNFNSRRSSISSELSYVDYFDSCDKGRGYKLARSLHELKL